MISIIFLLPVLAAAQNIIKGPYLVEPGYNEICIRWESDQKSDYVLHYGMNGETNLEIKAGLRGESHDSYLYETRLENLTPGTQYSYQIRPNKKKSTAHNFSTYQPEQKKVRLLAMGDSRSNPDIFAKIMGQVAQVEPDLIISMGDLVANGGNYEEWGRFYFSVAAQVIDHIPLVSTLGDHEGSGDDGELFRHYLRNSEPTDKQWFSFDYGDAHFISLDYRHPDNEEMISWFIKDVTESDARWKFVYMHRPCYNLGGHRSAWGRGTWPDLFRKYQVDIVFAGHSHQYERFYPLRPANEPDGWPVTYITTGGAGAGLYEITQNPYLAKAESVNHFVYLEISGDSLSARALRNDGSVLDEFTMIKTGKSYDQPYMSLVLPQENLDILTMFTRAVSFSIRTLPLDDHPARAMVNLKSTVAEDLSFKVSLSSESATRYEMEPVSGVLKGFESLNLPVNILSKTSMTVSRWGDIEPTIRLAVDYELGGQSYHIEGGGLEYWPGDGY